MIRKQFIVWLIMVSSNCLWAQQFTEPGFDHYSASDGLSHNIVRAIAQDSTGYVWAATSSGLNRFNGANFVQYHSTRDAQSLAAEDLNGMVWLDKKRLAVFTVGLHIINTQTNERRNLFVPYKSKEYQYKFNMIVRVKGDDEGNVFVLSRSGFYQFDKEYKLNFRFDFYTDKDVATSHFYFGRELFQLDDDRFFIFSIGGLFLYNKKTKSFKKLEASDYPMISGFLDYTHYTYPIYHFFQPNKGEFIVMHPDADSLVYINDKKKLKIVTHLPLSFLEGEIHYRSQMIAINDSTFYITGHNSGFYKMYLNLKTGKITLDTEKYFSSQICNHLMKDQDGNLWVATNNGLFRERNKGMKVEVVEVPAKIKDSLPNLRLEDVFVVGDKMYAGSRGHGGLLVFDKEKFKFEKQIFFDKYDGFGNSIFAFSRWSATELLLGTDGPVLAYDVVTKKDRKITPTDWRKTFWVTDLLKDRKNNTWIVAHQIYRYNPETKVFHKIKSNERVLSMPFVIHEDRDGNIWMAGHGLARYNIYKDSFDFFLDSFPFIKMADKQINSCVIDKYNNIWFNSNNNGLIKFNIDDKSIKQFTKQDGLPDDNISSMAVVGNTLWMSCFSNLACMDLSTFKIISFGKEDGFPETEVSKGSRYFYDSAHQQLYVSYLNSIVRFNPNRFQWAKPPPHLFIESVTINGNNHFFLPGKELTTSWNNTDVMITAGSINFSDAYSQRYSYRIWKDDSTAWQPLDKQTSFSISNLTPGKHRIQVKSSSLNNRWPDQIRDITIIVLPPFWQKPWFILMLATLLVTLLYFYVRWRTSLARKKEMEKTHIERLKADDYKNQFELEQISNYFSSSLAGKKSEEEVLWDVSNNLISRLDYVDCMIYLWNDDKTKMIQKAAYGPKGNPELISQQVFEVFPGQGIVGHVMNTCQPILVEDTRKDPRYRVDDAYRLSEVCVPIIHNGELLGILDSEHYQAGYFKERDIKILTTIATLIGNKLKQIESEKSLEETHKELSNINQQLAEAQLSALQAQMNPHFVFNALNSIKRMILEGNNEKASRYLSKFALMIRMTLNHSKNVFVTLDENLEYLQTYLEMEQLRFDDSFSYKIITDENIDASEALIPSMMIQPIVENAIWHGVLPSERDKKILIAFKQNGNKITCLIEDNGIGIHQSQKLKQQNRPLHQSVGLGNLKKRIKIMNEKYETNCTLQISDLSDIDPEAKGTRVILQFKAITL